MVDDPRNEVLEIELTEDELKRVLRLVEEEGVALEDWVRDTVLRAAETRWPEPGEE